MTFRRLEHLLTLALIVSLLAIGGCAEPPPSSAEDTSVGQDAGDAALPDATADHPTVTVATFNVKRFFDTECDTGDCGDADDWEEQPSQSEFDERVDQVATAIQSLEADIVLLQEIEKQEVLAEVASALGDTYPVQVFGETFCCASVDVGILARGSVVDSKGYRDRDLERPDGSHTQFAREFLRADIDIDGERVIVFTAHFTSKVSDDPGRRLAEAREARHIIEQVASQNDDALVVLGGDLNDTPGSEPVEALTGDGGLLRAGAERTLDEMFTYVYWGDREAIDHLLVARTAGGAYVDGSAHSVHDRDPAGLGGSDHGALVATFEMR